MAYLVLSLVLSAALAVTPAYAEQTGPMAPLDMSKLPTPLGNPTGDGLNPPASPSPTPSTNTNSGSNSGGNTTSVKTTTSNNATGTKISSIQNAATTSIYSGVAQVAAGITQISEYAQNKAQGKTQSYEALVTAVTNIGQGQEQITTGKNAENHANTIIQRQNSLGTAGVSQAATTTSVKFEREKAGEAANKLLDNMEEKAGVAASTLIDAVNENENVYNIAAGAKSLNMKGEEIETLAKAVEQKIGKVADPTVAPGMKMSDVVADLNMIMGTSAAPAALILGARDLAAITPEATLAPSGLPTSTPETLARESLEGPPKQFTKPMDLANGDGTNFLAWVHQGEPLGDAPEVSLFARVRYQYGKRNLGLSAKAGR